MQANTFLILSLFTVNFFNISIAKNISKPKYLCQINTGESISRCEYGRRSECWLQPLTIVSPIEVNSPRFSNVFELPNNGGFLEVSVDAVKFSEESEISFIFEAYFYRTKNEVYSYELPKYSDEYDYIKSMVTSETFPKEVFVSSFSRKSLECKLMTNP